jgi:hypothetical protein
MSNKLCEPLERFRVAMLEHVEVTKRFPLLSDLSFLHSDKATPGTEAFVKVIRKLLSSYGSSYDDRPLKKCELAMIEGIGRREILQAVLAKMFSEVAFFFNSQANEDMTIWKESLTYSESLVCFAKQFSHALPQVSTQTSQL